MDDSASWSELQDEGWDRPSKVDDKSLPAGDMISVRCQWYGRKGGSGVVRERCKEKCKRYFKCIFHNRLPYGFIFNWYEKDCFKNDLDFHLNLNLDESNGTQYVDKDIRIMGMLVKKKSNVNRAAVMLWSDSAQSEWRFIPKVKCGQYKSLIKIQFIILFRKNNLPW